MKIITYEEISNLNLSGLQMYQWVKDGLEKQNKNILPPKISLKPEEEIFYNFMPTILTEEKVAGVKVVNRYPSRIPVLDSQILLYDLVSGEAKALLDGNYITTARTGAVAACSIQLLAKKDFYSIGMLGLGNQARATVKVLASIFPKRNFLFKLKIYKNQHIIFAKYLRELFGEYVEITFEETNEKTIMNSDVIISSVTYFEHDAVSDDSLFKKGCLLVPIHTRGFMNCDITFDKVFADAKSHVEKFKYFKQFKSFGEITDVVNCINLGRENDQERIIAYNIGLAIHDIYFANKIFHLMDKLKIEEVKLSSLTEKFWFK